MEDAIVRTIAGFLNTNGGTLVVGVADDGNPVGIDVDGFDNEDKMSLHLTNLVNSRIGPRAWTTIHANFDDHDDVRVLVVRCERAPSQRTRRSPMRSGSSSAPGLRRSRCRWQTAWSTSNSASAERSG